MPVPANIDSAKLDAVSERIVGDPTVFFREHWRRRPLYAPGAGIELRNHYGVEEFLSDLVDTQPTPYISVSTCEGQRFFAKHSTAEELRAGILAGGVCAIKASKLWHRSPPASWLWMRALFGSLCRRVAMMYMTPARSEDVDIFLAGPTSCLGTHFDTTDVFTLQLYGERKWVLEEHTNVERILQTARSPGWYPAREIEFGGPTYEVTLEPGDALYAPAYGVHRVTGVSWSVSLSLGLRAFNEIDIVEHLLEALRLTSYMEFPPLVPAAEPTGEIYAEAKLQTMQRIRVLLSKVEGLALATLLASLKLPATLASPAETIVESSDEVAKINRSKFALDVDGPPVK